MNVILNGGKESCVSSDRSEVWIQQKASHIIDQDGRPWQSWITRYGQSPGEILSQISKKHYWTWGPHQEQADQERADSVLALTKDASSYGLGAVLRITSRRSSGERSSGLGLWSLHSGTRFEIDTDHSSLSSIQKTSHPGSPKASEIQLQGLPCTRETTVH